MRRIGRGSDRQTSSQHEEGARSAYGSKFTEECPPPPLCADLSAWVGCSKLLRDATRAVRLYLGCLLS